MSFLKKLLPKLFSFREEEANLASHDVYRYDEIPQRLRGQVVHIIREIFVDERSRYYSHGQRDVYEAIQKGLLLELGVIRLQPRMHPFEENSAEQDVLNFILLEKDVPDVLSAIEMSFRMIEAHARRHWDCERVPDAIKAINLRFNHHRIGYFYDSGRIHKRADQAVHQLAILPALQLLSKRRFRGPQEEFLKAHEQYRNGDFKEAMVSCGKAFESTLRVICDSQGWAYNPNKATASELIEIFRSKGAFPAHLVEPLKIISTNRNKGGGHGQGGSPTTVPESLATFQINYTASVILYLVSVEKELKST